MSAVFIPIQLDITSQSVFTIWVPRWRDKDDVWEAFLGIHDTLLVFTSIGKLYEFCQKNTEHDLYQHPEWNAFQKQAPEKYIPAIAHQCDFVDVMHHMAQPPSPHLLTQVSNNFDMINRIGQALDNKKIEKFFLTHAFLLDLPQHILEFASFRGQQSYHHVRTLIHDNFDAILDECESILTIQDDQTPDSEDADRRIQAAIAKRTTAQDTATPPGEDNENNDSPTQSGSRAGAKAHEETTTVNTVWDDAGIDLVHIRFSDQSVYCLRCYLDDDAYFFGTRTSRPRIYGGHTVDALIASLVENKQNFADIEGVDAIEEAFKANKVPVVVHPDNIYDLRSTDIHIRRGFDSLSHNEWEKIREILIEIGHFTRDDSLQENLDPSSPVGWFLDCACDHQTPAPEPPFTEAENAWKAIEQELAPVFTDLA